MTRKGPTVGVGQTAEAGEEREWPQNLREPAKTVHEVPEMEQDPEEEPDEPKGASGESEETDGDQESAAEGDQKGGKDDTPETSPVDRKKQAFIGIALGKLQGEHDDVV